jgi:hypothetical protein
VTYVTGDDPFAALGLPASPDLTDDEVRAAWRRIAATTHPDLPDGGDAARFAAAAAAYAALRTRFGRTEAYADLHDPAIRRPRPAGQRPGPTARTPGHDIASAGSHTHPSTPPAARSGVLTARRLAWRVRAGRPVMLVARILLAIAVCWACAAIAGWQPATLAIAVGAATWLIRTTRYDLAPVPAAGELTRTLHREATGRTMHACAGAGRAGDCARRTRVLHAGR